MDAETLTLLLRGEHISMPDRIDRGLWPHPPIKFSDVSDQLARVLQRERWFPREWHPHLQDQPVYEGGIIERKGQNKYVYRTARAWPSNPFVTAETTEKAFGNAQDAAAHYLKWDLHLPGDLDGWKVIE